MCINHKENALSDGDVLVQLEAGTSAAFLECLREGTMQEEASLGFMQACSPVRLPCAAPR